MIGLTLAYLRDRALTTALNVTLLALATATLVILLLFSAQLGERLSRDSAGIDLVVGAKGSPLQLILSSLYQIDAPTGNIPVEAKEMLERQPFVATVIPLAMGDNFRGFRIVGAEPSYLDLYDAGIAAGRMFDRPSEVVIGADVARKLDMKLGQRFVGSHGLGEAGAGHDHAPFIVVGVMARTRTVVDRLIVTAIESVWDAHGVHYDDHHHEDDVEDGAHDHDDAHDVHREYDREQHREQHDEHGRRHAEEEHAHDGHHHDEEGRHDETHDHDEAESHGHAEDGAEHDHEGSPGHPGEETELKPEVSALLIKYRNAALGATRAPRMINRQTDFQAAVPAVETARLLSLLGVGIDGVRLFAWLLALTGGLAIFIALLNAAAAREGDLALLRVMGASKGVVFITIMLEGLITAAAGGVLGVVVGHLALGLASAQFDQLADLGVSPWRILPGEVFLLLAVLGIGAVAAIVPAVRVFRSDLAHTLAQLT